jgi:hypothetical protein
MRARTLASQACGSTPFILAVTIRLYMAAAAAIGAAEEPGFAAERDTSQASFGGVVGETDRNPPAAAALQHRHIERVMNTLHACRHRSTG